MTMRTVQVVDQSSEETTRADHVIGVDESGNVTGPGPFALAAVRCPRREGELLAQLLVENRLSPWRGKSKTLGKNASPEGRNRRVRNLIEAFADEQIAWRVAFGYASVSIHHKAAGVCVLAKKTITSCNDFRRDSVLLPDGATSMYGSSQQHLRTQAAQIFDGSFRSAFGRVYATGLPNADLTYPEVAAADYLAGYVRGRIETGGHVDMLPDEVLRFSRDWREPTVSPSSFYRIRGSTGEYGTNGQTRVAAWVKGRRPCGDAHDVSAQWENTVRMLESDRLRAYLLEAMAP
jgi:hypothetical protein